jgi:hypothetical protein
VRTFAFDNVEVDFGRAEVRKDKELLSNVAKEMQLLAYLVQNHDRVIPREEPHANDGNMTPEFPPGPATPIAWLRPAGQCKKFQTHETSESKAIGLPCRSNHGFSRRS